MEIPETVWAEAKAAVFDMGHSEYWDDFQEVCECVARAIMAERERHISELEPIAEIADIILGEAPADALQVCLYGDCEGNQHMVSLDYLRRISQAIRNPLHKQT